MKSETTLRITKTNLQSIILSLGNVPFNLSGNIPAEVTP